MTARRRVEVEARIGAPVEPVFAHLADPCTWPTFVPAVVRRRRLDDGPVRVGSRWAATDRVGPFPFDFVDELLVLEPDRRVVWGSSSPWNSTVEYRCAPDGVATRVHATYEGDVDGWLAAIAKEKTPERQVQAYRELAALFSEVSELRSEKELQLQRPAIRGGKPEVVVVPGAPEPPRGRSSSARLGA